MNALISEGVQVITDEDRNHLSGSIRLRIRARFSLYKRRVTNIFRRRDHIAVKINDNVQHIRLSINNLKFESNNKEIMSNFNSWMLLLSVNIFVLSTASFL